MSTAVVPGDANTAGGGPPRERPPCAGFPARGSAQPRPGAHPTGRAVPASSSRWSTRRSGVSSCRRFRCPMRSPTSATPSISPRTGKPPPQGPVAQYSPQEQTRPRKQLLLQRDRSSRDAGHPDAAPKISGLRSALATHPSPVGQGGTSRPPTSRRSTTRLRQSPTGSRPHTKYSTRLAFMRLLSALIAAGTVLAVFMFLRELLPRVAVDVDGRRPRRRLSADVRLHRRRRPG